MSGGESRNREASTDVGGQSADDNPAAAARLDDGHRGEVQMVPVQDDGPTPRDRDDSIDRRGQGDGQLGQRCVADVDAGAPTAETEAVKN